MIHLREILESDLANVQKHAAHPEISRMSYVPSPYPENGAQSWFELIEPKIQAEIAKVYVIEYNDDFAGVMTLNQFSKTEKSTNVDYWVRADLHGKGIASVAVANVMDIAIKQGVNLFKSGCLAKNTGSKKVLTKNGFIIDSSFILQEGKYTGEEMILFKQTRTKQIALV